SPHHLCPPGRQALLVQVLRQHWPITPNRQQLHHRWDRLAISLGRWAMTMPDAFDRFLLATLVLLAAPVLPAAEPSSVDSAPAAAAQLKALNDQTIIQSSVWLDTAWAQYTHGAEEPKWPL